MAINFRVAQWFHSFMNMLNTQQNNRHQTDPAHGQLLPVVAALLPGDVGVKDQDKDATGFRLG
jgi:hypothetical protein